MKKMKTSLLLFILFLSPVNLFSVCCGCGVVALVSDKVTDSLLAKVKKKQKNLINLYSNGTYKSQLQIEIKRKRVVDLTLALIKLEMEVLSQSDISSYKLNSRFQHQTINKELNLLIKEQ